MLDVRGYGKEEVEGEIQVLKGGEDANFFGEMGEFIGGEVERGEGEGRELGGELREEVVGEVPGFSTC